MLDLAETLNPLLDQRTRRLEDGDEEDEDVADTTLQLVFFDGEEAFRDWTDTDSVYGARSAVLSRRACDTQLRVYLYLDISQINGQQLT